MTDSLDEEIKREFLVFCHGRKPTLELIVEFARFQRGIGARDTTEMCGAYLIDRAEQYKNSSGTRAALESLIEPLLSGEVREKYDAGEYDDLRPRIRLFLSGRRKVIPSGGG